MRSESIYGVSEPVIAIVMLVLLVLVTEAGFRMGRRSLAGLNEFSKSHLGAISASILGLLALLLGFTFAMALSRFDLRKQLVVEESNAIETTYLRSRLLPEPDKREVAGLLRSYVGARLDFYGAGIDRDRLKEANLRTEQLQRELWSHVLTAVQKDDREVTTGLFIESLNEVIDLHKARLAAMNNHVPESVLLLLFIVGLIAVLMVGYGCGLGRHRHLFSTTMQSFLLVLVIIVIIDLDRPRRGLIRVSQESMLHLQDVLSNASP